VSIGARALTVVSFTNRHVAAISYRVTLLDADAFVVISSEMAANGRTAHIDSDDPRKARASALKKAFTASFSANPA
jgi:alpha,alpha-trehalose phosphorylase